jgi:hypothetical protein
MKHLLLIILVILSFIPMAQAKDLSVGWELWYPYQYHNKHNELVGLDIESFNAIMAQAKLNLLVRRSPGKPICNLSRRVKWIWQWARLKTTTENNMRIFLFLIGKRR